MLIMIKELHAIYTQQTFLQTLVFGVVRVKGEKGVRVKFVTETKPTFPLLLLFAIICPVI